MLHQNPFPQTSRRSGCACRLSFSPFTASLCFWSHLRGDCYEPLQRETLHRGDKQGIVCEASITDTPVPKWILAVRSQFFISYLTTVVRHLVMCENTSCSGRILDLVWGSLWVNKVWLAVMFLGSCGVFCFYGRIGHWNRPTKIRKRSVIYCNGVKEMGE